VSLLDNGPHTVTIYPSEIVTDSYGNQIHEPSSNGVRVRCVVTPQSNRRDTNQGGPVDQTFKVVTREAPVDEHARVVYNEMSCTVDFIARHDSSFETRYVTFVIRRES
jgi:hypothetical protein